MKVGWMLGILGLLSLSAHGQLPEPKQAGGKYGYQLNGKWIVEPTLQYATHFSSGCALAQQNNLWGYLDSLGNWIIAPRFSQASPLHNGYGFVFDQKKRGVVGKGGKILLEPVCDSIISMWNYHVITKGKLRGFADENFQTVSPIIYTEIDHYYYNYFSCKKPSGLWDIYSEKGLQMSDVEQPLSRNNFLTNTQLMFLKKGGKFGVYQVGEGWKHEPAFDSIYSTPYAYYKVGNNYFREVFLLSNTVTNPDPDLGDSQSFQVMDGGGTILSKETFHSISNPLDNKNPIKFTGDGGTLFLYPELKAVHLPYTNIVQHLDWFIATQDGRDHILDNEFRELAVFDKVTPVMIPRIIEVNDEIEGFYIEEQIYADQTPYLAVYQKSDDQLSGALYFMKEKRVVTPYFENVSYRTFNNNWDAPSGYVYYTQSGNEGFYLPGMQFGTDTIYHQITDIGNSKMVCNNPKTGLGQLWDVSRKTPKLLLEEYSIMLSSSLFAESEYFNSPTDEVVFLEPVRLFQEDFFLCANEAGKLGILCRDGSRTACLYDEITQNDRISYLLNTKLDDRYGLLNIRNGETIAPFSDVPLEPDFNAFRNAHYVTIYDTNDVGELTTGYYLDQYGKYFTQNLNDNSRIFKMNGKTGLKANSEFDDKEYEVIPPLYKKLSWMWRDSEMGILEAKGSKGKWGALDFKGDTLIPFIYKTLENKYFYDGEFSYIIGTNGKKWGLYDQNGQTIIPYAEADSWNEIIPVEDYTSLISYKKGELYGVVTYSSSDRLPPVFEDVNTRLPYGAESASSNRILEVQRNGKWWAANVILPISYAQTYPDSKPVDIVLDTTNMFGPYDFIIGDWYFRENAPGDFTVDRIYTMKETIQEHGPMPRMAEGGLSFYVENGKIGVKQLNDEEQETEKILVKPTYTHMSFSADGMVLYHKNAQNFYYDILSKKHYNIESW